LEIRRRSFLRILGAAALAAVAPQVVVQAAPVVLPEYAGVATNPLFSGALDIYPGTTLTINDPRAAKLWARALDREARRSAMDVNFWLARGDHGLKAALA
jgi:hypothetical protein